MTENTYKQDFSTIRVIVLLILSCSRLIHSQNPPPQPPVFSSYNLSSFTTYPKYNISSTTNNDPFIEEVSPSSPRIYIIHNALTAEECAFLRSLAQKTKLRPSYVGTGGQTMKPSKRRTSQSTFLLYGSVNQPHKLSVIKRRLSHLTKLNLHHFADLQVNFYRAGGTYEPHLDWAKSNVTEQAWTILLCLSTVVAAPDQGGETVFVRAGIKVRPVEGMAIVFRNIVSPGVVDIDSLHGGAPLLYGEKWNANQWVMTQKIPFARRVSLPLLLRLFGSGGDIPDFMLRLRNALVTKYGAEGGYRALNRIANGVVGGVVVSLLGVLGSLTRKFKKRFSDDVEYGENDWID